MGNKEISELAPLKQQLKVEAALERVRARSMDMQHSEELNEVIGIVFKELTILELPLTRIGLWIIDKETESARIWMANPEGKSGLNSFFLPNNKFPNYRGVLEAWKKLFKPDPIVR